MRRRLWIATGLLGLNKDTRYLMKYLFSDNVLIAHNVVGFEPEAQAEVSKYRMCSARQWNPDITMYQGTGKITSLYRGIVINESRYDDIGGKQAQLSLYRG